MFGDGSHRDLGPLLAQAPAPEAGGHRAKPGRFGDVPDLTPEAQHRRGDAADEVIRELVRPVVLARWNARPHS
jgi:hypothetical protein